MQSMASHCSHCAFSSSPNRGYYYSAIPNSSNIKIKALLPTVLFSPRDRRLSYNSLAFQAVQLLGPPARFEASKLKVVYMGEEADRYAGIVPRNYILSHCDFTANLTLTISNAINFYQLKGWYNKDDVVAEWNDMKGDICLDVHCYVGGPNIFPDLAAEFRYHVFSKELPLVLKAVLHGDSILFKEHQELMDATVRVYFHSSSKKYNRVECWGPLKAAAQEIQSGEIHGFFLTSRKEVSNPIKRWGSAKSIFQAFVAFLL